MTIEDLVKVVTPPSSPLDAGSEAAKAVVKARFGLTLPSDIYDFASRYGTGAFSDTLTIYNPFAPNYFDALDEVSKCYQDLKHSEGDAVIPYDIYPDRPGLLACGTEVNGHMVFWLTDGTPDQWPLILMAVDFQFERRDVSLTTFLAEVFGGQTGCVFWDLGWVQRNLVGAAYRQTTI